MARRSTVCQSNFSTTTNLPITAHTTPHTTGGGRGAHLGRLPRHLGLLLLLFVFVFFLLLVLLLRPFVGLPGLLRLLLLRVRLGRLPLCLREQPQQRGEQVCM